MNIQEAKTEISNTLRAYLQMDEAGNYLFPTVRQRPIFLMGPPGIGKTAIMEQVARQQNVALVAYTMTHHTRQSAIGLPRITEGHFDGTSFPTTEYTMSEIIASVYAAMEHTGKREGILFLDEINCVSETLAPTMLQFLQNKTFGVHPLPEGWVIVAAGNPPEYNKSVRDFDVVTLDRIRTITVEPDMDAFLRYAAEQELHGAVTGFLRLKPEKFYHVSRNEDGVQYVTARGWEDLSRLLISYEGLNIPISRELVGEFLNQEEISREFYGYYRLYMRYGADYAIPEILDGTISSNDYTKKLAMAKKGDFTERFTVTNLVLHRLCKGFLSYRNMDAKVWQLHESLEVYLKGETDFDRFLADQRSALNTKKKFGLMDAAEQKRDEAVLAGLEAMNLERKENHLYGREETAIFLKAAFQKEVDRRAGLVKDLQNRVERGIRFLTEAFGDGQELTLLVSGLTNSKAAMEFIARHGSKAYTDLSGRLGCQENEAELQRECLNFRNT